MASLHLAPRLALFAYLFICIYLAEGSRAEELVAVAGPPISPLSDADRENLRALFPRLNQLALLAEKALKHDDDHSNVELDKLNEIHRYEIMPTVPDSSSNYNRDGGDSASSLSRLFSKMFRTNQFIRDQLEGKRSLRQLAPLKEDKDYSFVGLPILMNKLSNQQLQMATNKLRDKFASKVSQHR